jgi:membrane protein DedA with SNARE-associated domain
MELGEFGQALSDFVLRYGYWAIFILIFLESAGVPLPGETTLISASIYAATSHSLDIGLVIATAAAAAILGDNLGFWIGRRFGLAFLQRYGKYVRLTEQRLTIGQWLFRRYGGSVVFFGRFTALLRTYAALLAGALNYPLRRFFFWNGTGGIFWAGFFGAGGYLFGQTVKSIAGPLSAALFLVVVIGIVALWWIFRRHEHSLLAQARADAAANPSQA